MRLFWKIFLAVVFSFVLATTWSAYTVISYQIEQSKAHLLETWEAIADLLGREIETSQMEQQWPFESLHDSSQREGFLFWWIVEEDGRIHLSHDTSFTGTRVTDYLSAPLGLRNGSFVDDEEQMGVVIRPLATPSRGLTLWLGFSSRSIDDARMKSLRDVAGTALILILVLALAVYGIVSYFLRPMPALMTAIDRIGQGDLDVRVRDVSDDEVGRLAGAFNHMAAQLRQTTVSRDYMDQIVNSMIDPLIVVDGEQIIRKANPATSRLLGREESELVGQPLASLFPQGDMPAFASAMGKGNEEGTDSIHTEAQFRARDSRLIPVLLACSRMSPGTRSDRQSVCVARDISERKEAERVREQLIQELQEALAQVKTLTGLIPICAGCKRIRDDQGYWEGVEDYISRHSGAEFTHGLCPPCAQKFYPDLGDVT